MAIKCDACGVITKEPGSLHEAYKTDKVRDVCKDCGMAINEAIRKMAEPIDAEMQEKLKPLNDEAQKIIKPFREQVESKAKTLVDSFIKQ